MLDGDIDDAVESGGPQRGDEWVRSISISPQWIGQSSSTRQLPA